MDVGKGAWLVRRVVTVDSVTTLLLLPEFGKTAAELTAEQNGISHRAQALQALIQKLKSTWSRLKPIPSKIGQQEVIKRDEDRGESARSPRKYSNNFSQGVLEFTEFLPLSLYIHFPWCVRKCPYCDFNSHEVKQSFDEDASPRCATHRLRTCAASNLGTQNLHSVYWWWHTESDVGQRPHRLMSDLRTLLPLDSAAEITMEANPGTFEMEKFRSYRDSGINRLSIGIQSLTPSTCRRLDVFDGDEARRAIDIAQSNFENFNLDLMFALPSQSLEEVVEDVETALSFAPPHLSLYHLTLEPNTYFAKYPPQIPDDDLSAEMQRPDPYENGACGLSSLRGVRVRQSRAWIPSQSELLEFWWLPWHWRWCTFQTLFPHRIVRQMRHKQPRAFIENAMRGERFKSCMNLNAKLCRSNSCWMPWGSMMVLKRNCSSNAQVYYWTRSILSWRKPKRRATQAWSFTYSAYRLG